MLILISITSAPTAVWGFAAISLPWLVEVPLTITSYVFGAILYSATTLAGLAAYRGERSQ